MTFTVPRWWTDFVANVHEGTFLATAGKAQGSALGMPVIRLTAVGRRSGALQSAMLTVADSVGETLVLVASNMGEDRQPAWYHNVAANPWVMVDRGGCARPMHARVATPAERAELWPGIAAAHPVYGRYQAGTTRTIPLVLLDPVGG